MISSVSNPHGAVFSPERPTLQTLCCWGCPELSQVEEEGGSEWLSAVGVPACLPPQGEGLPGDLAVGLLVGGS